MEPCKSAFVNNNLDINIYKDYDNNKDESYRAIQQGKHRVITVRPSRNQGGSKLSYKFWRLLLKKKRNNIF